MSEHDVHSNGVIYHPPCRPRRCTTRRDKSAPQSIQSHRSFDTSERLGQVRCTNPRGHRSVVGVMLGDGDGDRQRSQDCHSPVSRKNGFSHRTVDVARNRRIVEKHARVTGNLRAPGKRGRVRVKLFASVLLLIELRRNMVQMSELFKLVD